MAEINVTCPHCGEQSQAPAAGAGKNADCPNCGKNFHIPGAARSPLTATRKVLSSLPESIDDQPPLPNSKTEVVLTDIRMPFGRMVVFMIKWAIASIPALIIFAIIVLVVTTLFMSGCAAMILGKIAEVSQTLPF